MGRLRRRRDRGPRRPRRIRQRRSGTLHVRAFSASAHWRGPRARPGLKSPIAHGRAASRLAEVARLSPSQRFALFRVSGALRGGGHVVPAARRDDDDATRARPSKSSTRSSTSGASARDARGCARRGRHPRPHKPREHGRLSGARARHRRAHDERRFRPAARGSRRCPDPPRTLLASPAYDRWSAFTAQRRRSSTPRRLFDARARVHHSAAPTSTSRFAWCRPTPQASSAVVCATAPPSSATRDSATRSSRDSRASSFEPDTRPRFEDACPSRSTTPTRLGFRVDPISGDARRIPAEAPRAAT